MKRLPTYRGYIVDVKLREFRKIKYGKTLEFIPFDSEKGDRLLAALIKSLPQKSKLFEEIKDTL